MKTPTQIRALFDRLRPVAQARAERRTRVLEAIAWPHHVEDQFFARHARELPEVEYDVDREATDARIVELQGVLRAIDGDDPITEWARANLQSMIDANRLVRSMGTTEFHRISRDLYGGSRTRFHGAGERNIDLAEHLLERLRIHGWDEATDPEVEPVPAPAFAEELRQRIARDLPGLEVDVVVDETATAKVVAGMTRVRVRAGATFTPWEAEGLWHHEVETHVLTAQNGAAQVEVPFLRAGGPRTTRTQEGLAVFTELYHHTLTVKRMERLAVRVKLVDMAEGGADFLDLYRYLLERGSAARDAYLDAQRVCRGGRVEGGAPFTKDAAYLAGLLDVNAFLAVMVRGGFRDEIELLVAGRIALEDLHALVILRRMGVLQRPSHLPVWLRRWNTLLPEFAFASFLSDLSLDALYKRQRSLIEDAASVQGPTDAPPEMPPTMRAPPLRDDHDD